ncbi:MAG: helix-turn-helix domain-containing protein [Bacteroidaceae bacterium]|nr:helix-turn-helix domain-containing protein [Bacteroidaceae bacterium]
MKLSERISRISELDYLKVARRMRIAIQIEEAMTARNMSKKDLALLMHRRPSEITKWLSGNQNFTSDILAELSYYLKTKITGEKQEIIVLFALNTYEDSERVTLDFPVAPISRPISSRGSRWTPVKRFEQN